MKENGQNNTDDIMQAIQLLNSVYKISNDALTLVTHSDPIITAYLYLAILNGLPGTEIQKFRKESYSVEMIRRSILEFHSKTATNMSDVEKKISDAVRKANQENQDFLEKIKNWVDNSLKNTKPQPIQNHSELQRKIESLERRLADKDEALVAATKYIENQNQTKTFLFKRKKKILNPVTLTVSIQNFRRFKEEILSNQSFSEEQVSFLMEQVLAGVPYDIINQIAEPKFSVVTMRQILDQLGTISI